MLLEIKFPYKRRNDLIISPAKEESHVDYIGYEGGQLKLKRRHHYYTQVQIAMYVTNTRECFFFVCVYTYQQSIIVVVERGEELLSEAVPRP